MIHRADSWAFGGMYGDEINQPVIVVAPNIYYPVPGLLTATDLQGFLFSAASILTVQTPGIYFFAWGMSINCAVNNQDLSGTLMIAGAATHFASHNFNGSGASKNSSIACGGIIRIASSQTVQLGVANHTAANNITIEHATLALTRIAF